MGFSVRKTSFWKMGGLTLVGEVNDGDDLATVAEGMTWCDGSGGECGG